MCQSLFSNKVADLKVNNKDTRTILAQVFPVNIAKFLRIPFYRTLLGDCF